MNNFRQIPSEENDHKKEDHRSSRNLFSLIFDREWFTKQGVIGAFPFVLFIVFLAMLYITNKQIAEKKMREIDKINKELKEAKWDYLTTKTQLMDRSKQTDVAKRVSALGLREAVIPPKKIVVKLN